jgi:hypothetical protein
MLWPGRLSDRCPRHSAYGYGKTKEEALADLRAGLVPLIEEFGIPDEMTLTVDHARRACTMAS